jgi:hypothetical protein
MHGGYSAILNIVIYLKKKPEGIRRQIGLFSRAVLQKGARNGTGYGR